MVCKDLDIFLLKVLFSDITHSLSLVYFHSYDSNGKVIIIIINSNKKKKITDYLPFPEKRAKITLFHVKAMSVP